MEENAAIDALLPLLHTRRQQLLVACEARSRFVDQTAAARELERHKRVGARRGQSSAQRDRVFIDRSERRIANPSRLNADRQRRNSPFFPLQVLLRAYIRSNRQAIIPLLEGVNFCSFEDSQKLLASAGMESELIALYSTHHKHELVTPSNSPHAKAISQILSPLSKPGLSAADRTKRLADLMHYLQKLGSQYKELIFDCSEMFYKESRSLVLDLFSGYDPVDGGEPISNEAILEQLHKLSMKDSTLQHPWEQNALEITFLRNLIWSKNNTETVFHTKLVLLYMSSISSLQENVEALQR